MARKPPTPVQPVVFELRHGIRLTVLNRATVTGIADFLAKAMNHFKHQRDVLKTDLYKDGPYHGSILNGRHFGGEADLTHPGDEKSDFITVAQWTDAVIWTYSVANTLEQIIEDLAAYRAADAESGSLKQVLDLLPSRSLEALQVKLRRSP